MATYASDLPTPTTLLQAVNMLLAIISNAPVSSLQAADTNVNAKLALKRLHDTSMQVQESGWYWNTEYNYPLSPHPTTGEIFLPASTLKVDPDGASVGLNLIPRGNRLYDADRHTYNVGKTVTVQVVLGLPYEELPQALRTYIIIRAARAFSHSRSDAQASAQFNAEAEYAALVAVNQAQDEADDSTLQNTNPHLRRMSWYRRRR